MFVPASALQTSTVPFHNEMPVPVLNFMFLIIDTRQTRKRIEEKLNAQFGFKLKRNPGSR